MQIQSERKKTTKQLQHFTFCLFTPSFIHMSNCFGLNTKPTLFVLLRTLGRNRSLNPHADIIESLQTTVLINCEDKIIDDSLTSVVKTKRFSLIILTS